MTLELKFPRTGSTRTTIDPVLVTAAGVWDPNWLVPELADALRTGNLAELMREETPGAYCFSSHPASRLSIYSSSLLLWSSLVQHQVHIASLAPTRSFLPSAFPLLPPSSLTAATSGVYIPCSCLTAPASLLLPHCCVRCVFVPNAEAPDLSNDARGMRQLLRKWSTHQEA